MMKHKATYGVGGYPEPNRRLREGWGLASVILILEGNSIDIKCHDGTFKAQVVKKKQSLHWYRQDNQHAAVVLLGINYLHPGYQTRKTRSNDAGNSTHRSRKPIQHFFWFSDINQISLFFNILLSSVIFSNLAMEIGISEAVSTGYLGILRRNADPSFHPKPFQCACCMVVWDFCFIVVSRNVHRQAL